MLLLRFMKIIRNIYPVFGKRVLDLLITIPVSLLLVPVVSVVAALIRWDLGSPMFYKQKRPGKNGIPFMVYKFRTMRNDKDKTGTLLPDDKRLTKLGSFLRSTSIDELPQLLNVIKGNLSLVGPRPLLMEYVPRYNPEQARRHEVKPGITGWAQVNGRNAISWDEKFKLDVWYVDNQSFLIDLKILWMTFIKVVRREGISQAGHATMPFFDGNKDKADDRV